MDSKYKEAFESIDMAKFYGMPKVPEILAKYAGSEYLKGNNAEAKRLGYESLSYGLATMDDHVSLITPLSWLAVIQYKDSPNTGIFILKYVVNLLQLSKEDVAQLGSYSFLTYSKSIKDSYHLLAKWLIDVGRIDEARDVLKLSKQIEYFQFIERSVDPSQIKSIISYTPSETKLLEQFLNITNKIKQQQKKEFLLKDKSENGLSKDETNLLVAIKNQIEDNKKLLRVALEKNIQVESNYLKPSNYVMGKDVVQLQYALSEDLLTVFVTGQSISLERHWKLDKKILHQKVEEFIKVIHSPKSNPKPAAQELYKLIFEPISSEIDKLGAKTIVLILEDVLRHVPFGALFDGSQYLVNNYQFPIVTPFKGNDETKGSISPPWQVSAMGVTQSIRDFPALPGVQAEVDGIVRHGSGSEGILPGQILLDKNFTSMALKEAAKQNYPVLHIASHFVFSPGTEVNSFLLMGDGQELTLGDIRTQNFDFSHVDLLTLSACETGMGGGIDNDGREIEGFGVTAQRQGAKSVLATLWPVADKSTAILMKDFYQLHQEQKLSKAEALREAQLGMLNGKQDHRVSDKTGPAPLQFKVDEKKPYAHPFYWAPFILMGNWT